MVITHHFYYLIFRAVVISRHFRYLAYTVTGHHFMFPYSAFPSPVQTLYSTVLLLGVSRLSP